jgi:hypothetical protein
MLLQWNGVILGIARRPSGKFFTRSELFRQNCVTVAGHFRPDLWLKPVRKRQRKRITTARVQKVDF